MALVHGEVHDGDSVTAWAQAHSDRYFRRRFSDEYGSWPKEKRR